LHRALREKRPHYRKRHDKLIFLHDNAPSMHTSTMIQNYLETLNWKVLPHLAYSLDLAPSDYHLFSLIVKCLSLSGTSILTKTSENGLMSGLKDEELFWRGIHKSPERKWEKYIISEGNFE